jgi:hypothetical protein
MNISSFELFSFKGITNLTKECDFRKINQNQKFPKL